MATIMSKFYSFFFFILSFILSIYIHLNTLINKYDVRQLISVGDILESVDGKTVLSVPFPTIIGTLKTYNINNI